MPRTHGFSRPGKITAEYRAWQHAKDRCLNPRTPKWGIYGGRGIRICHKWENDFLSFLCHVGYRPGPEYTLDRIDVNGDYEPGNVRWATQKVQQNNRSNTRFFEIDGQRLNMMDACEKYGINHKVIRGRMRLGWDVERMFKTPLFPNAKKQSKRNESNERTYD